MSNTQPEASPPDNFTVNVYRGCVLPEDYSPIRVSTWTDWVSDNPDDYNAAQLALIRAKLMAGGSWVCFMSSLETISAPEYYANKEPYKIPISPRNQIL